MTLRQLKYLLKAQRYHSYQLGVSIGRHHVEAHRKDLKRVNALLLEAKLHLETIVTDCPEDE